MRAKLLAACAFSALALLTLAWFTSTIAANRAMAQEQRAVAEAQAARAAAALAAQAQEKEGAADDSIEANNAATKRRLAKRIEAAFSDESLAVVLHQVAEQLEVEVLTQKADLEAAGVSLDAPISLALKRVRGDMLLDLALRQASPDLGYVVRDGIIIVATRQSLADGQVVRVYNCRDLLAGAEPAALPLLPGAAAPPAGVPGEPAALPPGPLPGSFGPRPAGGGPKGVGGPPSVGSGGMGGFFGGSPPNKAEQLQHVIRTTVAPDTWDIGGGAGTMEEFNGLLVVNQSEAIHDRIEKLLAMLREAAEKK